MNFAPTPEPRKTIGIYRCMELANKKCLPCEGGMPPLDGEEVCRLLPQVKGWKVEEGERELRKRFKFGRFPEVIAFVNRMAALAETEGHHPDFCVRYDVLEVSLSTHAVRGLSENDFILAAKIDDLVAQGPFGDS